MIILNIFLFIMLFVALYGIINDIRDYFRDNKL